MSEQSEGGCLCGAVRFEIDTPPAMAGFCCCRNCQKLSGAGHAFRGMVPEGAFRLTGETRGYTWRADSGSSVTTSFCAACGTPLCGRSTGFPGMVTFRVAALDDPSGIAPQMAVFVKRRQPWDALAPALPTFPEMPPAPSTLP